MTAEQIGLDKHDPAGMAAFLRERARCSREFLKLTDEQQIRQFMEQWQKNVLPHFAFRFEQAAELVERLDSLLSIAQDRNAEHCAEVQRLHEKCKRQRLELRRLNKTLRSMWEGVRFSINTRASQGTRRTEP